MVEVDVVFAVVSFAFSNEGVSESIAVTASHFTRFTLLNTFQMFTLTYSLMYCGKSHSKSLLGSCPPCWAKPHHVSSNTDGQNRKMGMPWTPEARELLKQGMRIGGPRSRAPGEPMTSYISRRRRWWTLVHEMDNTLELGDTVQGSMMLEQAGLSRFDQNMVLTYTKGQRTMTAIAESLLEQHHDVHHRGRETPTPTGDSSSPIFWRRRDTTRAYLAEADPINELTDTAAYGEEGISDDGDGEQDETEDDEIHETDLAALLGNSGEDPEADDALAEALQLDAVATVAWQRFNGKGKSNCKGKIKGEGKGKGRGNNLSL